MIGTLLLLPASLLAAQITISEVSAEREGGRVAITVTSDAMIDPEATSAKLGEGRLYLFVYDARVHEANRSWKNDVADGADEIRAHRHKQKVELAIPLGDVGCQGPVEIEKAPGGLRALVGCEGEPRPGASHASRPAVARPESKPESRVASLPAVPPSPLAAKQDGLAAALKAKLALDPEPAPPKKTAPAAPAPVAATPVNAPLAVKAVAAAAPLVPVATAPAAPASHDTLAPPSESQGSGSGGGVVFAGCALLAIAGAAFFFSRRRAVGSRRHIQILETASLGPKRALVVARVGDATMILGSSEAGITLLQSLPDPVAAKTRDSWPAPIDFAASIAVAPPPIAASGLNTPPPPAASAPAKIVVEEPPSGVPVIVVPVAGSGTTWSLDAYGVPAPEEEPQDTVTEGRPVGQAGLLARLFKRGTPANDPSAPRFEDLLEDSFEDQELRRKLALGLPGRVR